MKKILWYQEWRTFERKRTHNMQGAFDEYRFKYGTWQNHTIGAFMYTMSKAHDAENAKSYTARVHRDNRPQHPHTANCSYYTSMRSR